MKPRCHRFWHGYNLSKHVSVAFATFLHWERVLTKGLCTYYVRPLDGWVGYQGEYLGVHGGWVGPPNQYVHAYCVGKVYHITQGMN